MKTLRLRCVLIGSHAFVIDVEDNKTVADLKMELRYFRKPERQTLFLAKKDGKWLSDRDEGVQALMENKTSKAMAEVLDDSNIMDPQRLLSDFNFPCIEDDVRERWNERHIVLEPPYSWSRHKRETKRILARAEQRRTERRARAEQRRKERSILWCEARSAVGKWISSYFPSKASSPHLVPEQYYVIVRNVPAHVEKTLRVATSAAKDRERNERRYYKLVHAQGQARLFALLSWICAVLTLGCGLYLYGIDANLVRGSTSDFNGRRLWTVGIERAAFYTFPLLGSAMLKMKILYSDKRDCLKDKIDYSRAALV